MHCFCHHKQMFYASSTSKLGQIYIVAVAGKSDTLVASLMLKFSPTFFLLNFKKSFLQAVRFHRPSVLNIFLRL